MKNTVRAFVVALALAGFVSTTVASKAAPRKTTVATSTAPSISPTPLCWPTDPSHCGMD